MKKLGNSISFRNWFNEKILLSSSDFVLDQNIASDLKFLLNSQYWSIDKLENYQNEKLRDLVTYSYKNIQYYKELFDKLHLKPSDIQSREDLRKLPILTKDDIRKNLKNGKIIADNMARKKMRIGKSSGSTGEPLQYFFTNKSYSFRYACGIRSWYWMGYRLGDKYVKLSQNPRNNFLKKSQDFLNRSLYLFSPQLTKQNFNIIAKKINEFKPKIIRGYPDTTLFLANYIISNKIPIYSPKAITTTGNILLNNTRQIIEAAFNCKVYDSYSCEGGAIVAECNTHECYHSSMEYAITEIINDGKNVEAGEKGRLITTDLHNYAMPLIRYDTQDYITTSKNKCSCGKSLLAIEKIDGRDSDILITPSGKYLIVHAFTTYFSNINSVEQFQIQQNELNKFNILLKVNSKFTLDVEQNIYKYWSKYIGEDVKIEISVVSDIPLTQSGKRRFLIRNQDIKIIY